jgi:sigma-54 dependent transcriptional regulator, acetoin dehydrogenase operon transcriptional activator AcoR
LSIFTLALLWNFRSNVFNESVCYLLILPLKSDINMYNQYKKLMNYKAIKIKNEWKNFVNNKKVDRKLIPKEVYESWQRSKQYKVSVYGKIDVDLPNQEEISKREEASRELINVAGKYMEMMGEIITGDGLRISLFDADGYCLKLTDDKDVNQKDDEIGFCIGSNRSEKTAGTNAVCLALMHNKPVQLLGAEHYNQLHHDVNCSCTVIHNAYNEIIGAINIASVITEQTHETLGLVTSIGKAIENELAVSATMGSLGVMMDYITEGVVHLNMIDNRIESYNQKALQYFGIDPNSDRTLIIQKLDKYLKTIIDNKKNIQEMNNEEIEIRIDNKKVKSFLVSTRLINEKNGLACFFADVSIIQKIGFKLNSAKTIYKFDDIIGENPELIKAKALAKKIAVSGSSVLIYGENGTGKEMFAQSIHAASDRKDKQFVAINCGAIPSEIIESELFGYEPGSFTGAQKGGKIGKLEIASGGTLFLDEVESMPLNVQIKLLRALSSQHITKVGGVEEVPTNFRLISATKKDLIQEIKKGNFREDLYYRINIVILKLPALRQIKSDIPILAKYYFDYYSKKFGFSNLTVTPEFYRALLNHSWPGNIRELKNVIERSILISDEADSISVEHLPEELFSIKQKNEEFVTNIHEKLINNDDDKINIMKIAEDMAINIVLQKEGGNLSKAAKKLGMARNTLYQKIHNNEKLENAQKLYKKTKMLIN